MCITKDLKRNCADKKVKQLPRSQAALKYMLRLHLNINGLDFSKHLKQVQVRPAVLLHLLHFLIDRNHEVFRGKGSAEELYEQMAKSVEAEYPQEDAIPEALLEVIEECQSQSARSTVLKSMDAIKNATPGNASTGLDDCLANIRPTSLCVDKDAEAAVSTTERQSGAIMRFGDLHINVRQKNNPLLQFQGKLKLGFSSYCLLCQRPTSFHSE